MCSECILRRDDEGDWFTTGIRCPSDRRIATRQRTASRSSDQLPVDGIGALCCYTVCINVTLTYYTTSISTTRLASTCNIMQSSQLQEYCGKSIPGLVALLLSIIVTINAIMVFNTFVLPQSITSQVQGKIY